MTPLYSGTLQDLIDHESNIRGSKPPYFTASEFLSLAQQMLPVVQHLKANRVVHNDIRPANWLYRRDAQNQVVLVLSGFDCCLDVGAATTISTECKSL